MTLIDILTTAGTIDKIYFNSKSEFEVGDPVVGPLLTSMNVGFDFTVEQLMRVDSLDAQPSSNEPNGHPLNRF